MTDLSSLRHRVTLCGQPVTGLMHTCAFVDSREQQYEILLPFLREGLECNACLLTIVSPAHQADHLRRLREAGMDVERLQASEQLRAYVFEDTYLKDGGFSADRMLTVLETALQYTQETGFSALRGFGEMEWALSGLPGTEELIEYEARVNYFAPRIRDPLVCIYDVAKFSGAVMMDILSTHPKVILNGRFYENPYYMPPDEFLRVLRRRGRLKGIPRS